MKKLIFFLFLIPFALKAQVTVTITKNTTTGLVKTTGTAGGDTLVRNSQLKDSLTAVNARIPGSSSYIKNATSAQSSSNFNISGKGIAGRFEANNTDDSGSPDAAFLINRTLAGTLNGHGFRDNSVFSRATYAYNSFHANVTFNGSSAYDHNSAFQSSFSYQSSGLLNNYWGLVDFPRLISGSVTNLYSFDSNPYLLGSAITNRYGFRARDFVYTSGSVANNYGIYIDPLTRGGTKNYSIYTVGSTPSRFGGVISDSIAFDAPTIYNGSTSSNTLTLKNYSGSTVDNSFTINSAGTLTGGSVPLAGVSTFEAAKSKDQTVAFLGDFYSHSTIYSTTTAVGTASFGSQIRPTIGSLNTQNYTRAAGSFYGIQIQPDIAANANTFSVATMIGIAATVRNLSATATLTNAIGVELPAFTATGAITNSTYLLVGTTSPVSGNWAQYWSIAYNHYLGTGNVQIGSPTPTSLAEKLQVTGPASISSTLLVGGVITAPSIKLTSGAANGYILTSDASGNASWVASSSASKVPYTGATTDLDLVSTNKGLYAEFFEVGHGSGTGAGFLAGTIYNGSATGSGLLIQAGAAAYSALKVQDYSHTITAMDLKGNGNVTFAGQVSAISYYGTGSESTGSYNGFATDVISNTHATGRGLDINAGSATTAALKIDSYNYVNAINLFGDGHADFVGTIKASQFKLSALNTAPSSATDTGTAGEIRFTSTGVFICTATNTWIKATAATF